MSEIIRMEIPVCIFIGHRKEIFTLQGKMQIRKQLRRNQFIIKTRFRINIEYAVIMSRKCFGDPYEFCLINHPLILLL